MARSIHIAYSAATSGFGSSSAPRLVAMDVGRVAGCTPAVDRDAGQPAELADKVLDVRARADVDPERVLTREQRDVAVFIGPAGL